MTAGRLLPTGRRQPGRGSPCGTGLWRPSRGGRLRRWPFVYRHDAPGLDPDPADLDRCADLEPRRQRPAGVGRPQVRPWSDACVDTGAQAIQ